jgi:hypothetical protein
MPSGVAGVPMLALRTRDPATKTSFADALFGIEQTQSSNIYIVHAVSLRFLESRFALPQFMIRNAISYSPRSRPMN